MAPVAHGRTAGRGGGRDRAGNRGRGGGRPRRDGGDPAGDGGPPAQVPDGGAHRPGVGPAVARRGGSRRGRAPPRTRGRAASPAPADDLASGGGPRPGPGREPRRGGSRSRARDGRGDDPVVRRNPGAGTNRP